MTDDTDSAAAPTGENYWERVRIERFIEHLFGARPAVGAHPPRETRRPPQRHFNPVDTMAWARNRADKLAADRPGLTLRTVRYPGLCWQVVADGEPDTIIYAHHNVSYTSAFIRRYQQQGGAA